MDRARRERASLFSSVRITFGKGIKEELQTTDEENRASCRGHKDVPLLSTGNCRGDWLYFGCMVDTRTGKPRDGAGLEPCGRRWLQVPNPKRLFHLHTSKQRFRPPSSRLFELRSLILGSRNRESTQGSQVNTRKNQVL